MTIFLSCCTFCAAIDVNNAEADSLREWMEYREEHSDGQLEMLQKKSAIINKHQEASEAEQWLSMGEIHEHMTESELGVLRTKLNAGLIAKGECGMDLRGAGGNASICEQGYLQVASLCCNFQMELFIVRVITSMGYQVCHEGGVMGMIPWFTCGNFQTLGKLKAAINAGSPAETPCPIVGRIGQNCTEWSWKCWNETIDSGFENEGQHRRRVCESGKDRGAGPDWTHESESPGPAPPGQTIVGPTTTIIGGGGGTGTQVVNIYNIGPSPPPIPYPTPAPEPCNCGCLATFQLMAGTNIMQATITGDTEEMLDYKCCQECVRHDDCEFWVRQFHTDGRYLNKPTICYLRNKAGGESYNLGYRGGWRTPGLCYKADPKACLTSMQEFSGSNVVNGKIPICGKDDHALDAACQKACVEHRDCTHWFRDSDEGGLTACQLRYNPGSEYKNRPQSRGGWKQGCGKFETCDATFQDRGGPQVMRMGVYGANHAELDAACCHLCALNKDCEHWVREWGNYGNRVCYLRKNGGGPSWSWTKRGGWNKICGDHRAPKAFATFQEMAGILVATERVCGLNNTAIDTQCAFKCISNSLCDYWVRDKNKDGFTTCWLRKFNTKPTKSANANRRGGYRQQTKCGSAYVNNGCKASFQHLSGTQVALEFVCGKDDDELDAHCCELCRNTTDCQFWVRETRKTTDTDERPKLCYLRKNFGGASKHATFRGGFRQGCGSAVGDCKSTFQERGGPQVEIVGVCNGGPQNETYLDAACCQKCAENPDCEFWVRDVNYPLEVHGADNVSRCYLRKIGALNPSVNVNKRGGWNSICGVPNVEKCASQFQDQAGLQIAQLRICGKSDEDLDAQCCHKCKENDFCEYWIREKASKGYMYCWLRRRDSPNRVPNANVNRRGGYRENAVCGSAYLKNGCRSTFYQMSGAQVGLEYVCGKNDDELDAHCCAKCRNNTQCEFWVREVRPATETDITRPKICWLRKNAGSGSRHLGFAGGWRQGCGTDPIKCAAGFQERGGAQVAKVGVCGADPYSREKEDKEYLDSVCCQLCATHPDCEFWVREIDLPTKAQGGENTSFCYLRKNGAATSSASTTKRGGWNRICGNPSAPKRKSTFQDLAGSLVDTTRVCGKNDTALDTQCAFKCSQHDFCDHWVRDKGAAGWVTCWLRSTHPNPNVKPNANVNRRGGYKEEPKCGDFYLNNSCKSTFFEMSGAQVDLQYVCGNNDDELDAHCCALCRNHTDCEFWVRERRLTWEEDATRPKICWLRKNAGGASNNAYRRGGWKSPCGANVENCWATFQDRSGPQVQKLGACGSHDRKYLDSVCCELCAQNPECEFWVRETDIPFKNNTFCYLRKLGAANPTSRTNKRGGWNKICGNPKLPVRRASFQNMGGGLVETTRICANTSGRLDTECAAKCKQNEFCEFWLRETHPTYKDEGYKYCWLYRKATSKSASTVRRGGFREQKPCGAAYMKNGCTNSSFWELSGAQAALVFVCGDTDAQLDAMCCDECKNNTKCEFWVRESGESGVKQCWLRYNPGGFSKNLARRGGWKDGCAKDNEYPAAKATFQDWGGPEVDKRGVCGDTNEELDSACAFLCDGHADCEYWVREHGQHGQTNQKNSKFCWLRKIAAATQASNANRRGGRKKCNSKELPASDHTFQNMGGSHIETNRTCGDNDKQLDAGCAAKCEANPDCQMWLRESMAVGSSMGYKYCWLYKNPAAHASNHPHRRGGFRKQELPQCGAQFKDFHGRQLAVMKVYGETDDILDAACCFECTKRKDCEIWVREYHGSAAHLIPGGKHCWLRAKVPGGSKRNANSRRGGMKMGLLLETDSQIALGALEEGAPLTKEEEKAQEEEQKKVAEEAAQAAVEALALGDYISTHDNNEGNLHVLGATQMAEATRSVHNKTALDQAAVKMIQEQQATEMKLEEEALQKYYQHKLNTAGETAVLDEEGYKSIASLRSNEQMSTFIRRTIDMMNLQLVNEGGLSGLTPFYSGEQQAQNFETLQLELENAAHGSKKNKWVVVKEQTSSSAPAA